MDTVKSMPKSNIVSKSKSKGWQLGRRLSVQRVLHWPATSSGADFPSSLLQRWGFSVSEPLALNDPNSSALRSVRLIFPLPSDEHGEEEIDATYLEILKFNGTFY